MSVTKTTRECYEVRNRGEWANIMLAHWDRPSMTGPGIVYGGEIAIHSSFGSWAYTWTHCGVPFKRFLCSVGFDYAFGKLMGAALDRHDGDRSFEQIKRDIILSRRTRTLTKQQARAVWECVDEEQERLTSDDATNFGYAMLEIGDSLPARHPMHDYFMDPAGWPTVTSPDAQAVGFWRDIWPEFTAALMNETTETVTS